MNPYDFKDILSRCNGCYLQELKEKYGQKLIKIKRNWYVIGEKPADGQSEPKCLFGTPIPIRFVSWFMSEGHACGK